MQCRREDAQVCFEYARYTVKPLGLILRPFVHIESQPRHAVQKGVHILSCGTLPLRVFDSQYELTTVVTGTKPAEQCCADTPDVQNAARAGSEARVLSLFQYCLTNESSKSYQNCLS